MPDLVDIVVSVDRPFLERLDLWRRREPGKPERSEAVKALVEEALILREALSRQQTRF
jgi:metal-responsive CopG/Arc/MetJ family transcriptional regulator